MDMPKVHLPTLGTAIILAVLIVVIYHWMVRR